MTISNTGGHSSNQEDCGPENRANAKLISAATELLAACKAVVAFYHGEDDDDPRWAEDADHTDADTVVAISESRAQLWEAIMSQLEATITKAAEPDHDVGVTNYEGKEGYALVDALKWRTSQAERERPLRRGRSFRP